METSPIGSSYETLTKGMPEISRVCFVSYVKNTNHVNLMGNPKNEIDHNKHI